jgi:hypothetical protein
VSFSEQAKWSGVSPFCGEVKEAARSQWKEETPHSGNRYQLPSQLTKRSSQGVRLQQHRAVVWIHSGEL